MKSRAIIKRLMSSFDRRAGNTHEVIAPDGFCFEVGLHSQIATSADEARRIAKTPLAPCRDDCDCREDDDILTDHGARLAKIEGARQ